MITLPFQPQFNWRKLGYQYYTNSLEYRSILELNPQWEVTELPPLGAQIYLPNSSGVSGGLKQATFVSGESSAESSAQIFPFDTESEYNRALDRYTLQGVFLRERLNGYTEDSEAAFSGIQ